MPFIISSEFLYFPCFSRVNFHAAIDYTRRDTQWSVHFYDHDINLS